MKEIRMDDITFGQVEKIIQSNHGISKVPTNQNRAFLKKKFLSFLTSTSQRRALFIGNFLSFLISTEHFRIEHSITCNICVIKQSE